MLLFVIFEQAIQCIVKTPAITFSNFLRQPYPYYFGHYSLGKIASGIFVLGFFFVYFFEPFNVSPEEHKMPYFWISLLHVGVSCLVFYGCFTTINLLKIEEEKWTIGKEILSLSVVLLLMGLANFLIRDLLYNNPNNWSLSYLLEEIKNTFLVGLLIIFLLVPLNFAWIYGANSRKAETFKTPVPEDHSQPAGQIFIQTQLKSDDFSIQLQDFLFAKSEGNYVEVHLNQEGKNVRLLKRITIKELEKQLEDQPWIVKTHRSYLVNLKKVTAVSGNAQGYQLSLQQDSTSVPVSRGMIKKFDEAFAGLAL